MQNSKVKLTVKGHMIFLEFFNFSEVYAIKGFDTIRQAENYANRHKCTIYLTLPKYVKQFENVN